MAEASALSSEALEKVDAVLWRAKAAQEGGNQQLAGNLAMEAWEAVPQPRYGWDRTYMFLFALFRFGRLSGRRKEIIDIVNGYLKSGFHLDSEDGPYFWLGALHFEEGQYDLALENLKQAVRISRGRCFREEDPKYKKFFDEQGKGDASAQRH